MLKLLSLWSLLLLLKNNGNICPQSYFAVLAKHWPLHQKQNQLGQNINIALGGVKFANIRFTNCNLYFVFCPYAKYLVFVCCCCPFPNDDHCFDVLFHLDCWCLRVNYVTNKMKLFRFLFNSKNSFDRYQPAPKMITNAHNRAQHNTHIPAACIWPLIFVCIEYYYFSICTCFIPVPVCLPMFCC